MNTRPVEAVGPPPGQTGQRGVERRHIHPLEALRRIRLLINDPEDTAQVFHIIRALSGDSFERLYQRVMAHPGGGRVLAERTSLLEVLSDTERLRALPEGSFGREYASFIDREDLSAAGLVEASEDDVDEDSVFLSAEAENLSARLRDVHDLWHVLTGYGRDLLGEDALLAFTYAQTRNPGIGFIVLAGIYELRLHGCRHSFGVIHQAYRRGRAATLLAAVDFESLLELPLDIVRATLGIDEPPVYEPVYDPEGPLASRAAA